MNIKKLSGIGFMLAAMAMGLSNAWAAKGKKTEPETPLPEAGQKLLAKYSDMLTALRVEIALVKGQNVLHFTRSIPNYGLTIKEFTLTPVK